MYGSLTNYNKDGERVAVEGISTTINDIYGYYKSLKVISPQSSIKLNRLQVVTGPLDDMELAVNDNQKIFDFDDCKRYFSKIFKRKFS